MNQRNILATSLTLLALALLASGWMVPAAAQTQLVGGGQAFGTFVTVGDTVSSQKSSVVGLGCSLDPAFTEDAGPGVDASPALSVGQIHTTAERRHFGDTVRVKTTAVIEDVDILEGLISATAVEAVSVTRKTDTGLSVGAPGSQFANLTIAGVSIDTTVPPNTQMDLLGFGHVILNERRSKVAENSANHRNTMIRVVVDIPNPLVPVGTEIIVGNATSRIIRTEVLLGGSANGGVLRVSGTAILGPLFQQGMPCGGTNGQWLTNSGTAAGLPGVFNAGEIVSSVKGIAEPLFISNTAKSTIQDVNVLSGLVTAQNIVSWARIEGPPDDFVRQSHGSKFVGLQVAGFPAINDDVPVNTMLDIAGLGELWLKRVTRNQKGMTVRMIELFVLEENDFGLPVGATLRVGFSGAIVRE